MAQNAKTFGSFGYSSGESVPATSDAQNVDYGTGTDNTLHVDTRHPVDAGDKNPVWNATRENITSDFGSVRYPFLAPSKRKEKPIPAAIAEPNKGSRRSAGFARGVGGGGGKRGTAWVPAEAAQTIGGVDVDHQRESEIRPQYRGQLGSY